MRNGLAHDGRCDDGEAPPQRARKKNNHKISGIPRVKHFSVSTSVNFILTTVIFRVTTASSPYACVGKRDEKYFTSGENHVEQCNSLELAEMICPIQRGKQQTHTHNSCTWKAKLLFNCYLDSKLP
ncbi:conserved hypothetical protein [Trichinella spiralis]|uniref:hypothetical protein n=1 Tax=Trichinella spiralis TaxID=6334 RepID=UPI0001EFE0DF|nr:conserved hypothetical protein [Trichinella spiralis]